MAKNIKLFINIAKIKIKSFDYEHPSNSLPLIQYNRWNGISYLILKNTYDINIPLANEPL